MGRVDVRALLHLGEQREGIGSLQPHVAVHHVQHAVYVLDLP
jgi:hypothetical protein